MSRVSVASVHGSWRLNVISTGSEAVDDPVYLAFKITRYEASKFKSLVSTTN